MIVWKVITELSELYYVYNLKICVVDVRNKYYIIFKSRHLAINKCKASVVWENSIFHTLNCVMSFKIISIKSFSRKIVSTQWYAA